MGQDINTGLLPWENKQVCVLVVGDLILDEYLDGQVNRISPEAPVPVHRVGKTHVTAGGAANVARNIQLVGGKCHIVGIAGHDGAGDQLRQILKADGIDIQSITADPNRPTTRKTRITSNHQQLVRIDWEDVKPIQESTQAQLFERIKQSKPDTILISDYGKGCLTPQFLAKIIKYGQSNNICIVVDPKGHDYTMYQGADLITPNWKEACEALGLDTNTSVSPNTIATRISEKFSIKNVLVTLGSEGMLGRNQQGEFFKLDAQTREVFDVSGAGDTVVALMALSLATGLDLPSGMNIANSGAGKVVEKWGTQPLSIEELKEAIAFNSTSLFGWSSTRKKIAKKQDIIRNTISLQASGKSIVFTNGCFDLLHAGHLSYLEEARSLGHVLIVAVNSDESVRKLKGNSRPLIPCEQRMSLLAGLECVDYVVEFSEETPESIIKDISPDILVKGADYEVKDIVGADFVLSKGGRVERIAFVDGLSTSKIIERAKTGAGVNLPM